MGPGLSSLAAALGLLAALGGAVVQGGPEDASTVLVPWLFGAISTRPDACSGRPCSLGALLASTLLDACQPCDAVLLPASAIRPEALARVEPELARGGHLSPRHVHAAAGNSSDFAVRNVTRGQLEAFFADPGRWVNGSFLHASGNLHILLNETSRATDVRWRPKDQGCPAFAALPESLLVGGPADLFEGPGGLAGLAGPGPSGGLADLVVQSLLAEAGSPFGRSTGFDFRGDAEIEQRCGTAGGQLLNEAAPFCAVAFARSFGTCFSLQLLHTNGVWGRLLPRDDRGGDCQDLANLTSSCAGGAARRAGYIKAVRARHPGATVAVDPGSHIFGGTGANMDGHPRRIGELLRLQGYTALGINQGDFLSVRGRPSQEGLLEFTQAFGGHVLSTNMRAPSIDDSVLAFHVELLGGFRVGFVSVVTAQFPKVCDPPTGMQLNIQAPPGWRAESSANFDAAQAIQLMRQRHGVQLVVLLSSLEDETETTAAIAQTLGVDVVVCHNAEQVSKAMHALYLPAQKDVQVHHWWSGTLQGAVESATAAGKRIPVVAVPEGGRHMGHLRLDFDEWGNAQTWSWRPVLLGTGTPVDAAVEERVRQIAERSLALEQLTIAHLKGPVEYDEGLCLTFDCPIGRAYTDALLAHCGLACDAAMVHSGTIRAGLPQGNISMADVRRVVPSAEPLALIDISGWFLKKALRHGAGNCGGGGHLQAAGLRFSLHWKASSSRTCPSEAVRAEICKRRMEASPGAVQCLEWGEIDHQRTYRILTTDFLASGGDGYAVLRDNATRVPGGLGEEPDALRQQLPLLFAENWSTLAGIRAACDWTIPSLGFSRDCRQVSTAEEPSVEWQYQCRPGHEVTKNGSSCTACQAGRHSHEGICVSCAAGTYAKTPGQSSCSICPEGSYSDSPGSTDCERCPPGYYAGELGGSKCEICLLGHFAADYGSTRCERCSTGRYLPYANGTGCLACNETFVTMSEAAASEAECTCAPGFAWTRDSPHDVGRCEACPQWLVCPGGLQAPLQNAGFDVGAQAFPGARLGAHVALCGSRRACPEGRPLGRHCPANREPIRACDKCIAGYREGGGECEACEATSLGVRLGLGAFVTLLLLGVLVVGALRTTMERRAGLLASMALGQLVNVLQMSAAFSRLLIDWVDILPGLSVVADLPKLRLDVFHISCLVPARHVAKFFAISLLAHPAFAALVLVAFGTFRLRGRAMDWDRVLNIQGAVMMIFFLSVACAVLAPFQCVNNPDGSRSVSSEPSVECWRGEQHVWKVVFALAALLSEVVTFVATVCWATWRYPVVMRRHGGISFVHRFSFLFKRFNKEHYYYGVVYLTRNLLVAVIPSLVPDSAPIQIYLFACVMISCGAYQCRIWPWRFTVINLLDLSCNFGMLLVMIGGILMEANRDVAQTTRVVQTILALVFGTTLGGGMLATVVALYRIKRPRKRYALFLSHHKHGAAMLARWMKLTLSDQLSGEIFLDSDNLSVLYTLAQVVAEDTRNLVVLLTKETLSRIWCACEITAADRFGVNIVPVDCGGYAPPDDAFLEQLPSAWSDSQKADVAAFGVDIEHIMSAYVKFRELPLLTLSRQVEDHPDQSQEILKLCVAVSCRRPTARTNARESFWGCAPILIQGQIKDLEAACCCHIVQRLLQQHLCRAVAVASDNEELHAQQMRQAQVVLLMLTPGVLEDTHFAVCLAQAIVRRDLPVLPIVASQGFSFPSEETYVRLARGELLRKDTLLDSGVSLEDVMEALMVVMGVIAVRFSGDGAERTQQAEIAAIAERVGTMTNHKRGLFMEKARLEVDRIMSTESSRGTRGARVSEELQLPAKDDAVEATELRETDLVDIVDLTSIKHTFI